MPTRLRVRTGDTVEQSGAADFAGLLRRTRLATGLSQEALAERAGVSVRAIMYLERGARMPYPHTIGRLASALELSSAERAALIGAAHHAAPRVGPESPSLVLPATPLIGREHEVARVRTLLANESTRLLTLTGMGGVGKTRLAMQLVAESRVSFDAVAFVSLAAITDPAAVIPTIAQTLGLGESRGLSVRALARWFRAMRLLLVLDNFEQVLAAASDVAALVAGCPQLVVIVTSRAALHVGDEQEWPVPPLALPAVDQPLGQLARVPAVALFLQRARRVRPLFAPSAAELSAIGMICQRLDGLPLAIELAAARINVLTPHALLARLDRRLVPVPEGQSSSPQGDMHSSPASIGGWSC